MLLYLQAKVANWCLRNLLHAVTEEQFMEIIKARTKDGDIKGSILINKQALPENQVANLAREARIILALDVYKKVRNSMRTTASKIIFEEAATVGHMQWGKAVLYATEVMDKKLKNLAEL